jgi:hypothetical protein
LTAGDETALLLSTGDAMLTRSLGGLITGFVGNGVLEMGDGDAGILEPDSCLSISIQTIYKHVIT